MDHIVHVILAVMFIIGGLATRPVTAEAPPI
jgi:hypothetical protein